MSIHHKQINLIKIFPRQRRKASPYLKRKKLEFFPQQIFKKFIKNQVHAKYTPIVLQREMKWFKNYFSLRLTFIKLRGLKKIQLMYHPNHFNINFKLISRYIFIISNILLIINTKLKTALHMLKNRKFHINSLTKNNNFTHGINNVTKRCLVKFP